MEKDNDLENLFKESFDKYEPEVRPKVWDRVKLGLKWGGLAFFINAIINKIGTTTLIAVITSVAALIGITALMNSTKKNADGAIIEVAQQTADDESANVNKTSKIQSDRIETAVAKNNAIDRPELVEPETAVKSTDKKNDPTEKVLIDEGVANIAVSAITGAAPLIVDFSNTGSGTKNKWKFADEKILIHSNTPIHVFDVAGTYAVILSSSNSGKVDDDTVAITVADAQGAPKEFSPNGDGKVDEFVLQSKNITHMSAKIYNKAGELIYESEGTDAKWNGKSNAGAEAPVGIYYYKIVAQGHKGKTYNQTGAVKLTR